MLSDAEILTDAERLERSMGEIISKMNYRLNCITGLELESNKLNYELIFQMDAASALSIILMKPKISKI